MRRSYFPLVLWDKARRTFTGFNFSTVINASAATPIAATRPQYCRRVSSEWFSVYFGISASTPIKGILSGANKSIGTFSLLNRNFAACAPFWPFKLTNYVHRTFNRNANRQNHRRASHQAQSIPAGQSVFFNRMLGNFRHLLSLITTKSMLFPTFSKGIN